MFVGLKVETFIGGLPLEADIEKMKNCQIAVGAPGRVKHLIQNKILNTNQIRLLVFDEADKLMEQSFADDVDMIFESLPIKKQIIASSATYLNDLDEFLSTYMTTPTHISTEIDSPLLLGLRQFASIVKCNKNVVQMMNVKTSELIRILTHIPFGQCLIFSNYQTRVESISNTLNRDGWNTTYISSAQNQMKRLETMEEVKNLKCRILLTTDLISRGIDLTNVDLVVNYDLPTETSTYLHRMGRAGRFGTRGIAISIVSEDEELGKLKHILAEIGGTELTINVLPETELTSDLLKCNETVFEQVQAEFQADIDKKKKADLIDSVLNMKKPKKRKKRNSKGRCNKEVEVNCHNKQAKYEEKNALLQDGINVLDFNVENVGDFLNANKKQEEKLQSILQNDDAESLILALANNTLDINEKMDTISNVASNSNTTEPDFIKKVVEETKKRKRTNLERNETSSNRSTIYERNVSLLYLTNLLLGTYNTIPTPDDVLGHVDNLLKLITAKEEQRRNALSDICITNIDKHLQQNEKQLENPVEKTIEDVFQISYDYCIDPDNSMHWGAVLKNENKDHNKAKKSKKNNSSFRESFNENDDGDEINDGYYEGDYNEYETTVDEQGETYNYNTESNNYNAHYYDNETNLSKHFENIYNQHKTKLMEFTESCGNLEEFNQFYTFWQKQLKLSTDYVQQNLYLDVMNSFRYYKNYE